MSDKLDKHQVEGHDNNDENVVATDSIARLTTASVIAAAGASEHDDKEDDDKDIKVATGSGSQAGPNNANSYANSITNDAVEAAVMRYVGGDYNQWTSDFLSDDLTAVAVAAAGANHNNNNHNNNNNNNNSNSNNNNTNNNNNNSSNDVSGNNVNNTNDTNDNVAAANTVAKQALSSKSSKIGKKNIGEDLEQSKKKKRKLNEVSAGPSSKTNALVDPELAQLDSTTNEHDQLVQAAINDAKELARLSSFEQDYILSQQNANQQGQPNDNQGGDDTKVEFLPKDLKNDPAQVELQQQRSMQQTQVQPQPQQVQPQPQQVQPQQQVNKVVGAGVFQQMPHHELSNISHMHNTEVATLVAQAATNASAYVTTRPQGKMFSKEEHEAIQKFIQAYCQIHKMTEEDICKRVWSNNRVKDNFWDSLQKVLPHRTRASVYKHVRRAYHIFSVRGKWTPEEDAQLGALAKDKEGQWKAIGEIMGRMPEDCRDRWRNYVKCGASRAQNKWSPDEEDKLKSIIHEIFQNNPQSPVINWTVVSEKMGGLRSRIQCRYKWNKLLKRQATVRASQMDAEDRIWLITRLKELQFEDEGQVEWDALASLHPKGYWTGSDFKVSFEKMRSSIKDFKNKKMDDICNILLHNINGGGNGRVINNNGVNNRLQNVGQVGPVAEHQHHQQHQHHHHLHQAQNVASNNMFDQMNQIVNDQAQHHQPGNVYTDDKGKKDHHVDIASAAVAAANGDNSYLI
ncbi:Nsi1 protein [Saccharomycopsis crataegensis]|uniref:Nsi1 protein n=1 Tax=Saccharomycopsis crataegensis TaxID=43959 RepID=A0AAV5QV71_9ASCO|nr:Nsi1 protein [Saccharomycopsis crataegensis]